MSKIFYLIYKLFAQRAGSAFLLGVATLLALILSNSPWRIIYQAALQTPLPLSILLAGHPINSVHLMNDGLMVIFFLLVTLEVKQEFLGESVIQWKAVTLPLVAAIGGVVVPALLYCAINNFHGPLLKGWAVPTATDIAFSLGILSLMTARVPIAMKLFLSMLALFDDLCAILIIALFYTQDLQGIYLATALGIWAILGFLNKKQVSHLFLYIFGGVALWGAILLSGIHATIAGVMLGLVVPLKVTLNKATVSPLHRLEAYLHPWVNYFILPLFAFMNAGLSVTNFVWSSVYHPLFLGIVFGLLIGKPVGILLGSWIAIKLNIAQLPSTLQWRHLVSIGFLGGIGFTMSLFISMLAFTDEGLVAIVRQGVFASSVLSASFALGILINNQKAQSSHIQIPSTVS